MKGLLIISVFLLLASYCSCSRLEPWTQDYFDALDLGSFGDREAAMTTFNPMDYGAVGNGQTDDSLV